MVKLNSTRKNRGKNSTETYGSQCHEPVLVSVEEPLQFYSHSQWVGAPVRPGWGSEEGQAPQVMERFVLGWTEG